MVSPLERKDRLNDDLFLVPFNMKKLIEELEQVNQNIQLLEVNRSYLIAKQKEIQEEYLRHMPMDQHEEFEEYLNKFHERSIKVKSLTSEIFSIHLDFLLPYYQKTIDKKHIYYLALKNIFRQEITAEIAMKLNQLPKFAENEKVFVLIVQYFNGNKIVDLDNRFHSFLFNALRGSHIVQDDNWKQIAYMEDGRPTTGKEHTEVFVGPYSKIQEIFTFSQTESYIQKGIKETSNSNEQTYW